MKAMNNLKTRRSQSAKVHKSNRKAPTTSSRIRENSTHKGLEQMMGSQLMKVMNISRTSMVQFVKSGNRVQKSRPKDARIPQSILHRPLQLMMELKSMRATDKMQTACPRTGRVEDQVRTGFAKHRQIH
jgi:hypothetical protein